MDTPPVTLLNPEGRSRYVLLCEHASNYLPAAYAGLGLPAAERARHIAWDIGAAALCTRLSALLDAPAILSTHSRLLIDCNRPLHAPSLIPLRSEATDIPGNRDLDTAERQRRIEMFWQPFQAQVTAILNTRQARGRPTAVVGIHSFTPVFLGEARPWHAGVLYGAAQAFAERLLGRLRAVPALAIGANAPYRVTPDTDYTVPVHGDARGLEAALFEIRQDLLQHEDATAAWAARLASALSPL
jgi:predicted N-formylglutamate amidohydrolase